MLLVKKYLCAGDAEKYIINSFLRISMLSQKLCKNIFILLRVAYCELQVHGHLY